MEIDTERLIRTGNVKMYAAGIGFAHGSVLNTMHAKGIAFRRLRRQYCREFILQNFGKMPVCEIANQLGVSRITVQKYIRRLGLHTGHGGDRRSYYYYVLDSANKSMVN